jgi:hypothetical protein
VIGFPKPRPRALEKKDRLKRKQSIEDRENAKVKARSGGWCEVRLRSMRPSTVGAKRSRMWPPSFEIGAKTKQHSEVERGGPLDEVLPTRLGQR